MRVVNPRRYRADLVGLQLTIRREMLGQLYHVHSSRLAPVLERESGVLDALAQLVQATQHTADEVFFSNYQLLVRAIYHLLRGVYLELHAEPAAAAHLRAVPANLRLLQLEAGGYPPPFREQLRAFVTRCAAADAPADVAGIARDFCRLSFPTIYAFEVDARVALRQQLAGGQAAGPPATAATSPLLLAVEFTLDNEPWASPQLLRPNELYTVRGTLTPNRWPVGFDHLVLRPDSTAGNSLYEVVLLPVPRPAVAGPQQLTGHVVVKFPQAKMADSLAIRLVACYENARGEQLLPTILGYDELLVRVPDPAAAPFPNGFRSLSQAVADKVADIQQALPGLDPQELNDFTLLFNGIVNYQGMCLQQGLYKERDKVSEEEFRDSLIRHLMGLEYLGEQVIKEQQLAGGRVEVCFRGIVAELKVEKTITDRTRLLQKYGSQAAAYAAGNAKQLSLVLDLTAKTAVPASSQNNILLGTPALHGFTQTPPAFPSRQVLVVVEGNTRNPSTYSR